MAYSDYLRQRARELRVMHQLTLDELVERLALPRTTDWYWIRDLPLQRPRDSSAAQRKGTRRMVEKYRRLREAAYEQGVAEYPRLLVKPTFRDFVVLYIAEGYKRNRNTVSLCNSDPGVVVLAARWLRSLSGREPVVRVTHHRDQDPAQLAHFWGEQLGIAPDTVRFQPKTNSAELRTRVWRCAHGVASVDVYDTALRARLQAWIDLTKASWGTE